MSAATAIKHHHHLTLCTGTAQEDYDFHTGLLGLKSVKKTALYDGTVPIYHLYYANDMGDESTIITCFPMRQSGRVGRKGSGQVSAISLSVPASRCSSRSVRPSPSRSPRPGIGRDLGAAIDSGSIREIGRAHV